MASFSSVKVLGVNVSNVSEDEIIQLCRQYLLGTQPLKIYTLNGEICLQAQSNPQLLEALNSAQIVTADSTNILLAAWIKGSRILQKNSGADLVPRLSELACEMGKSVYLLGAAEGVAEKAAQALKEHFPKLAVAGCSSANPDEDVSLIIHSTNADIVFVAYGAPNQEIWIQQNAKKSGAKVLIGVGGVFDMLSGRLPRAPKIMRQLSLEWLWRLIIQPSRTGRIWRAVVIFPLKVLLSRG